VDLVFFSCSSSTLASWPLAGRKWRGQCAVAAWLCAPCWLDSPRGFPLSAVRQRSPLTVGYSELHTSRRCWLFARRRRDSSTWNTWLFRNKAWTDWLQSAFEFVFVKRFAKPFNSPNAISENKNQCKWDRFESSGHAFCQYTPKLCVFCYFLRSVFNGAEKNGKVSKVLSWTRPHNAQTPFGAFRGQSHALELNKWSSFILHLFIGAAGGHSPKFLSRHFVLWEAVSQTKYCCSPKIESFVPQTILGRLRHCSNWL